MKIAPLYHTLRVAEPFQVEIVHTGQHYDLLMSETFFQEFHLPPAHYALGVGSGTHAQQTAQTMIAYEAVCLNQRPDLVIVVGDVNATLACALAAKKLQLRVAHLEAGLRSFDQTMPEEINRRVTDCLSDYHWTSSQEANENLLREGIPSSSITLMGNIMVDAYCIQRTRIQECKVYERYAVKPKGYVVVTFHRPSNVDHHLPQILHTLQQLPYPVIFPVHPRTRKKLDLHVYPSISYIDPLGYVDFMSLLTHAAYVISDSGGIQEETTFLGIPCFTLRENTERPITVTMGSNQLISLDNLLYRVKEPKIESSIPPLWDGKTAERIRSFLYAVV